MLCTPLNSKLKLATGLKVGALISGLAVAAWTVPGFFLSAAVPSPATTVVAVVGGQDIPRSELDGLLAAGMDPAIARDAVIQRAVLAMAADKEFPVDAAAAANAVSRDAKAQVFLAKKADSLAAAITEEDLSKWYTENIRAENYQQLKVRFFHTANADEAREVARLANEGDHGARAKYAALSKTADGFLPVVEIPYDLGRSVAQQKPGVFSEPVMVRTGALSLVLDEVRAKEKPTLEATKEQIRQILVRSRLGEAIGKLRAEQKIELRG